MMKGWGNFPLSYADSEQLRPAARRGTGDAALPGRTAQRPNSLAVWLREARLPFMTASVMPVVVGTAVAWSETGAVHWTLFLLTLAGAVLSHAGANMANDYYDWASGNDEINRFRSPFNGGAGVIQDRLLTPRQVHVAALLELAAAGGIGLYLTSLRGPAVLVLALLGGLFAYFYTADPLHLAYYGVGEILVGASFGPLLVAGTYLVQAGRVSAAAVLASVPVGLLITAVLYINQFPDYEADKAVGKAHWVVRLGTARALPGLAGLLAATYLFVPVAVALGLLPWPTLVSLLSAPLAAKAYAIAHRLHASPVELRPANALVIATHLCTGLLLAAGFLLAGLLGA